MWLVTPFLGFYSHHDGLMLTTVQQLQTAMRHHGSWPFNQYGSFWAIFDALVLWFVPPGFQFIALRILTLGIYFVTAYLLLKIARKFGNKGLSSWALIFLLGNQPFVFDLLPWPSAHAMLLSTGALLLALKITDDPKKGSVSNSKRSFLLGLIIPTIIVTRAQIGLLIGLCLTVWLFGVSKRRLLPLFVLGFTFTSIVLGLFLNHFGWIAVSLKDEFIFGATYIGQAENPMPLFTTSGTLILVSLYYLTPKLKYRFERLTFSKGPLWFFVTMFSGIISLFLIYLSKSRSLDLYSALVLVCRRLWISALLASVLIFALNELATLNPKNLAKKPQNMKTQQRKILAIFGLLNQFQIYPLFDQMHSWWGSIPGVLIMAILISESIKKLKFSLEKISFLQNFTASMLVIISLVPWSVQIFHSHASIGPSGIELIWTSKTQADEMNKLQQYFRRVIPINSSVLNLCPEPDVFFNSGYYNSSAREFVFWPRFYDLQYMKNDFSQVTPEYVVSCYSLVESHYRISIEKFEALYGKVFLRKIQLENLTKVDGRNWQIWTVAK